jgi:transcriptional regulator with XRE-family HTH domain
MSRKKEPDNMKLGDVLRKWRLMNELDLRSVGAEIGISAATLLRIEQGSAPDSITFMLLLNWLMDGRSKDGRRTAA